MGEAIYYCKARFATSEDAEIATVKLHSFLDQGRIACEYWQDSRREKSPETFWAEFKDRFPDLYRYLELAGLAGGDCNNALAGNLSFGSEDALDSLECDNEEIRWHEPTWHHADWEPLCRWIEREYGAKKTGWVSDEYVQCYDLIDVSD